VKGLMNASMEELSLCPGVGAKKVRQLLETFQEPFTKQ
jgi:DNA excision repair protein ERCC-1